MANHRTWCQPLNNDFTSMVMPTPQFTPVWHQHQRPLVTAPAPAPVINHNANHADTDSFDHHLTTGSPFNSVTIWFFNAPARLLTFPVPAILSTWDKTDMKNTAHHLVHWRSRKCTGSHSPLAINTEKRNVNAGWSGGYRTPVQP